MKTNQHIINAPEIGNNQRWNVDGYLCGQHVRQCPRPFEQWHTLQYVGHSNGSYHFIGNGDKVLICSIQIK